MLFDSWEAREAVPAEGNMMDDSIMSINQSIHQAQQGDLSDDEGEEAGDDELQFEELFELTPLSEIEVARGSSVLCGAANKDFVVVVTDAPALLRHDLETGDTDTTPLPSEGDTARHVFLNDKGDALVCFPTRTLRVSVETGKVSSLSKLKNTTVESLVFVGDNALVGTSDGRILRVAFDRRGKDKYTRALWQANERVPICGLALEHFPV
ncbi:MAG: hypothetical protein MHM6MM_009091, partial [Cercozoa sp. M6MM]